MKYVTDERNYLCSELISVLYEAASGSTNQLSANLEQISAHAAVLCADDPIDIAAPVCITVKGNELFGTVESLECDPILGYFVRVKLDSGYEWSGRRFVPKHFFALSSTPATVDAESIQANIS